MIISLSALNRLPDEQFVAHLADIYEHSAWVARIVAGGRPFSAIGVLHDAMAAAVRAAPIADQDRLIRAHPDLAGKAAKAGHLTAASTNEQAHAGLDRMSESQFERFDALNDAYRQRFGFPFIIAVRDHGVEDILRAFVTRLDHSLEQERAAALEQITRIARLRLNDKIEEA